MELKKAVTELRSHWERWGLQQWLYGRDHNASIRVGSAISVAETLLAALEKEPGTIHSVRSCPKCGGWSDSHAILCPRSSTSTLAGRTVDGWGWKVFRLVDGMLRSEYEGRGYKETELKEGTWLHHLDWASEQYCRYRSYQKRPVPGFHIFESEGVAQKWKELNLFYSSKPLVVRKVAWCNLRKDNLDYVIGRFKDQIFTAEEIYILPEEGMPGTIRPVRACPECGGWEDSHAILCSVKPAERPPEKGDWVTVSGAKPESWWHGIWQIAEDASCCPYLRGRQNKRRDGWGSKNLRIVRRAADPLREGDKVSFGSKEGEVKIVSEMSQTCRVKFDKTDVGWFNRKDLTLLEPVYDRPAEKGDC